ncbi:MAG: hypothetical protein LBQ54_01550 [Planctomycetaceae bacterium]|jgi:hypothetical protein|nr:hypothetical protein [Planctomycetaceae bacterium]
MTLNNQKSQRIKCRLLMVSLLLTGFLTASGCQSGLFTVLYLIKGQNTPAEFKSFKGKKVVIVCRALSTTDYTADGVPREIAHRVHDDFEKNIRKIKLADQDKVDQSLKKKLHQIKDFRDFGTEFDTDYVLGIELERFQTVSSSSPGNYQGHARFIVKVFDMNDGGKQVFSKSSSDIIYPPNSVIDSAARSEDQFNKEFIHLVAYHIGKSFYSYNPHDFVAEDAKAGL